MSHLRLWALIHHSQCSYHCIVPPTSVGTFHTPQLDPPSSVGTNLTQSPLLLPLQSPTSVCGHSFYPPQTQVPPSSVGTNLVLNPFLSHAQPNYCPTLVCGQKASQQTAFHGIQVVFSRVNTLSAQSIMYNSTQPPFVNYLKL